MVVIHKHKAWSRHETRSPRVGDPLRVHRIDMENNRAARLASPISAGGHDAGPGHDTSIVVCASIEIGWRAQKAESASASPRGFCICIS
jgi:hypothetical protein